MNLVATNTRRIIGERGLKHRYVAEQAGINHKLFSAMLTGRKIIREEHIVSIANALDIEPSELLRPCT